MSARVIALICGLLLATSGCGFKTPKTDPPCMPNVKTPLIDIPRIEQLGIMTITAGTTEISTSGGIKAYSIGSEANHWAVRLPPPNESIMILVEPGSQADKTGFPYSILSNDGEKRLYLQKEQCTSLFVVGDALAYRDTVTLTVYAEQK